MLSFNSHATRPLSFSLKSPFFSCIFDRIEVVLRGKLKEDIPISEKYPIFLKWLANHANPLVAERAFRASEYWGLTRVSEVHGK